MDPTGNITALVRTEVDAADRPFIAGRIMTCHPEVEQVGFLRIEKPEAGNSCALPELAMTGGEFCGNASISAAAICLMEKKTGGRTITDTGDRKRQDEEKQPVTVFLRVSGVCEPVEISLWEDRPGSYQGRILMPKAREIICREFSHGSVRELLPVVRMGGISHIIIDQNKEFFRLVNTSAQAEAAVRSWCEELEAEGLGLMFLEKDGSEQKLIPLVYIPGSDTVYWENSCASGTSAVGMYLAEKENTRIDLTVEEPGGILRVKSDPQSKKTWLHGRVQLVENLKMELCQNHEI